MPSFSIDQTLLPVQHYIFCVLQQSSRAVGHFNMMPNKLHFYFGFKFQCDGWVSQYELFAKRTGSFYVSTWRQQGNTNQSTNMGYNEIKTDFNYTECSYPC